MLELGAMFGRGDSEDSVRTLGVVEAAQVSHTMLRDDDVDVASWCRDGFDLRHDR